MENLYGDATRLQDLLDMEEELHKSETGGETDTALLTENLQTQRPSTGGKPRFYLLDMAENRLTEISKSPFSIGCGKDCDLVIPQSGLYRPVSRLHCIATLRQGSVFLKDLSTNGTYIGEAGMDDQDFFPIPKGSEAQLLPLHIVRFAVPRYMLLCRI